VRILQRVCGTRKPCSEKESTEGKEDSKKEKRESRGNGSRALQQKTTREKEKKGQKRKKTLEGTRKTYNIGQVGTEHYLRTAASAGARRREAGEYVARRARKIGVALIGPNMHIEISSNGRVSTEEE